MVLLGTTPQRKPIRTALVLGVDKAGSVSWRSRAWRLVGSAARRFDGPSAHRPSGRGLEVNLRRSARSDHETELAARSPGGADANFSFSITQVPRKKVITKKTFLVRGYPPTPPRFRSATSSTKSIRLKQAHQKKNGLLDHPVRRCVM